MEKLSRLKDVEMMRIKTKKPLLDQTRGLREEELEKNQSQPVHQRKRPPRQSHHEFADKSAQAKELMHTAEDLEEPAHSEFVIGVTKDQPGKETFQLPDWFQKPSKPPTPDRDWNKTLSGAHGPVQPWLSTLAQKEDTRESFNELMDTPLDFSAFMMNWLKVDTLTPELLVGPTFELMKGSCKSLVELEYFFEEVYKATTNQLDWNNPEVTKTKAANYGHIKWIEDLVPNRMWSQVSEYARDVHSKRRISAIIKLQIVEWHNYKHLDWITIRRDDDKLYKFKEGDFKRLRIQDIKDMLLLLVQGKLTNLTVEEHLAFNVSLRCIYQNKYKKNRLMRIDELHKFSDGTLNDVRTALDGLLKGIRMKYLPQAIWRQSDRDNARAMIQVIDKQLKTKRIIRSLKNLLVGDRTRETFGCCKGLYDLSYDVLIITGIQNLHDPARTGGILPGISIMWEVLRFIFKSLRIILMDFVQIIPLVISFTMKMEILLEPTSNRLMVGYELMTDDEFLMINTLDVSQNHFSSNEVLKLKIFKKDALLKLFKIIKSRKVFKITFKTSIHKLMIEVKDCELKTNVNA
ncbi:hypothetical protein Tco_0371948 [Tanacetum coccineum]